MKDKTNRNTMFLDYRQGGLRMMNFPGLLKSRRVKKLLIKNENRKWKQYFNFVTRDI